MGSMKKFVAEFIGTMVLVILGCGVAVATGCEGNDGIVATALAFGLVIVAMAYSIGNVSGCHINPAVSTAMLILKKISVSEFCGYVISQILGATVGSLIVGLFFGNFKSLGGNAVQDAITCNYTTPQVVALLVEMVLTFVFVLAIVGVTSKPEFGSVAGIVIGLALVLVHLLGIRLTGTSVNPARSLGPAIIQAINGETTSLTQVWIFIVGPIVGGSLAAGVYSYISSEDK